MTQSNRRDFMKTGVALASTLLVKPSFAGAAKVQCPTQSSASYRFFTDVEVAFIRTAVDLIFPKDKYGPSGTEARVDFFIDGQLASDYGAGAWDYMQGPFAPGEKTQGYQLPLSPAKLYRLAIAGLNEALHQQFNKRFDELHMTEAHNLLASWEQGKGEFAEINTRQFFQQLYTNTLEGYYADPVYGGNCGHQVWTHIGFPGATPVLMEAVGLRNKKYKLFPLTIG